MTYVDKGVDATILDKPPCSLCRREIRLSEEGDIGKGVAVHKLDGPLHKAQDALYTAEEDGADQISLPGLGLLSYGAELTEEIDDGDKQTSQADGTETVRQGPPQGASGNLLGEGPRAIVPRAVDTGNGGVNRILEPLGHPVHGEGAENDETGHLGIATIALGGTCRIVSARPTRVDGHNGNRVPCGQGDGDETADEADEVDVAVLLGDVDRGGEHQDGKGDALPPRKVDEYQENAEQEVQEAAPAAARQHVDTRHEGKENVENEGHDDELLGPEANEPHVAVSEHEREGETKDEEDQSVGVEAEVGVAIVDAVAVGASRGGIAADSDARDCGEASDEEEKLQMREDARVSLLSTHRTGGRRPEEAGKEGRKRRSLLDHDIPRFRPKDHSTWACRP